VNARVAHLAACASLTALIALCLAWELWLAPLRPGGSWLALKALLLILAYFAEGLVRAWSDAGVSVQLALAEIVLATAFFASAIFYVRRRRSAK